MSEKKLRCSRCVENFYPPYLTEKLVHKACESAADAFLSQIEYGKDYVINTELVKEDWADGFGTKYTYNLKFDELVRCRDCKHYRDRNVAIFPSKVCQRLGYYNFKVEPDGFCAWGERKEVE